MSNSSKGTPHSEEHKENLSKARNTTGYLNVSKRHDSKYKQGFCWRYLYSEKGKRKEISRVNLNELEKEVLNRGLKWKKFKEEGDVSFA